MVGRAGLLACLVAVLFSAGAVAAQDSTRTRSDSALVLPPIEITGSIRPLAGVGSGIPARVTVLASPELKRFRPRTLPTALEWQPGFSIYDDVGSPLKLNLTARGFAASPVVGAPQGIAVFLDGVRMNEADAAEVNFDLLPLDHVRQVELLSGNAALLGRNAIGGAINLVTARGDGPRRVELEVSGGSFGGLRGTGSVAGSTSHGLDYYVGASADRQHGWRQATADRRRDVFVNLGWSQARSGLRIQGLYAGSRALTAGSLPEAVYRARPDSNLTPGDDERLHQLQASVAGYGTIGRGRASARISYRHFRARRFNGNQQDDPDAFGTAATGTVGYTADYRREWRAGTGATLGLRVGVDGSISRVSISLFADSTKFGGGRIRTTEARAPIRDLAPFVLTDLARGRVTVSAGVRLDHVVVPFHDLLDPSADATGRYTRLNPRIGISVDLGRGFGGFGSWARTFRAPSVIENACADPEAPCPLPFALGDDPPLRPLRASTVEAGATYASERFSLSATGYSIRVRDDIFVSPKPTEPGATALEGYFVNLDRTGRRGLELAARYLAPRGHAFSLGYAWTRATFESPADIASPLAASTGGTNRVEPGDRLPAIPSHQLKAGVDLVIGGTATVGAGGRWVGPQWLRGDEANRTRPLPGYLVVDGRVGTSFGAWEITGTVTNLADRRFVSFGTFNLDAGADPPGVTRFFTPGPKRAFQLTVRRTFGAGV